VASYPQAVARVLDETGQALGIDIRALLSGKQSREGGV
jgi:hypothetical protein